jgi:hypothetical protein
MTQIKRSHECDLDGCQETFTITGDGSTPFSSTKTLGGKYFCSPGHKAKWRHDNPEELDGIPFFKSSRSSPQSLGAQHDVVQLAQSGASPFLRSMKKI